MSPSIIFIEGLTVIAITAFAPFRGTDDEAPIKKKEGTSSIPTESALLAISVLSIAHPFKSQMSILKLPELSLFLGLRILSQVINIGPFEPWQLELEKNEEIVNFMGEEARLTVVDPGMVKPPITALQLTLDQVKLTVVGKVN